MLYYCEICGKQIRDENQLSCHGCGRRLKLSDEERKLPFISPDGNHKSGHYEIDILNLMDWQDSIINQYDTLHLPISSKEKENINCRFKIDFKEKSFQFTSPRHKKRNNLKYSFSISFSDIRKYEKSSNGLRIIFNDSDSIILKNHQYDTTLLETLDEIIRCNKPISDESSKMKESLKNRESNSINYELLKQLKYIIGFRVSDDKRKLMNLRFDPNEGSIRICLRNEIQSSKNEADNHSYEKINLEDIIAFEMEGRDCKIYYKKDKGINRLDCLDFKFSTLTANQNRYMESLKKFLEGTIDSNRKINEDEFKRGYETYLNQSERMRKEKAKSKTHSRNPNVNLRMNFCFKCGAKLVEDNQRFCIKCGTDLSLERKRREEHIGESEPEVNHPSFKSHYEIFKENNQPEDDSKSSIRHDEEMPALRASESDDSYSICDDEEEDEYIYSNDYDDDYSYSQDYDDDYSYGYSSYDDKDESYTLYDDVFGMPQSYIKGNEIREHEWGAPKYVVDDNNYVRETNRFGNAKYYIDGNYVKEGGVFGKVKYYIDGDLIREGGPWGRAVRRKK